MFNGFIDFIKRGNVIDLAVALVLALAFSAIVTSLVDDIINPIVAAIIGKPDLSNLTIDVGDAVIRYGAFLTTIINFLIVAAAIYFLVVKPVNALNARARAAEEITTKTCPDCLSEIPALARRCAFCGQPQ